MTEAYSKFADSTNDNDGVAIFPRGVLGVIVFSCYITFKIF